MNNATELSQAFTPPSTTAPSLAASRLLLAGRSPEAIHLRTRLLELSRQPRALFVSGPVGSGTIRAAALVHHLGQGAQASANGGDTRAMLCCAPGEAPPSPTSGTVCVLGFEQRAPVERARLLARAELDSRVRWIFCTEHGDALDTATLAAVRGRAEHLALPRLSERVDDLEALALQSMATLPLVRPIGGLSSAALDCLRRYPWPGELAEFEAVLREAVLAGAGVDVELRDLPKEVKLRAAVDLPAPSESEMSLEHAERRAIRSVMDYAEGNKRRAARILGIGKTTLYRKLKLLGFE